MVVNGQIANENTFNTSFLSRTSANTSTLAIVALLNTAIESGASVSNVQALLNKLIEGLGTTGVGDLDINNYGTPNYVVNGQSRKAAITALDTQLFTTQTDLNTAEATIVDHESRLVDIETNNLTLGGNKTFSGNVVVNGNFTVQGTTTYINSTDLAVTDKAILVNKDGDDTSADMGAGIEVKRTSDNGAIHFDSTKASKWKVGTLASMYEVLVSGIAQTIAGAKTFTSAIAMSAQKITGLADPTDPQDAATKAYSDKLGGMVRITGTGGLTALNASSFKNRELVGTLGQTFRLPTASAVGNGATYVFINNGSAGELEIQDFTGLSLAFLGAGMKAEVRQVNTPEIWAVTLSVFFRSSDNNLTAAEQKIVELADPTDPQDAATKNYVDSVAGGSSIGKNRIINGNMLIDQRNEGVVKNIAHSSYNLDRWVHFKSNAATTTVQRVNAGIAGISKALRVGVSVADATIAAGDYEVVSQQIEGQNVVDFALGNAAARTFTVSFWVKATKTGVSCIALKNRDSNRTYVAEFTINASNTPEYKTITLTGDLIGTWITDAGIGLGLHFALAAGTTFQTSANTWAAGDFYATVNQVNHLDNVANVFEITNVQVELGAAATEFEYQTYAQVLRDCRRYFEKSFEIGTAPSNGGSATTLSTDAGAEYIALILWTASPNRVDAPVKFKETKRVSPTLTQYGNNAGNWIYNALSTFSSQNGAMLSSANLNPSAPNTEGFRVLNNVTSSAIMGAQGHWTANAEL